MHFYNHDKLQIIQSSFFFLTVYFTRACSAPLPHPPPPSLLSAPHTLPKEHLCAYGLQVAECASATLMMSAAALLLPLSVAFAARFSTNALTPRPTDLPTYA